MSGIGLLALRCDTNNGVVEGRMDLKIYTQPELDVDLRFSTQGLNTLKICNHIN